MKLSFFIIIFAFVLDNLASESESDSEEKYKEEFIGGYDDKTEDNFNGRWWLFIIDFESA